MNIKIGKYRLRSDQYSMWITEEYVKEQGRHKGETAEKRVAGYAESFEVLLRQFVTDRVMDSDAESLETLLEQLSRTIDEGVAIAKAVAKGEQHGAA